MRPWRTHKRVFKQDQMDVNYTADEFLWSELSLESERINRRRVYLPFVKCTQKFVRWLLRLLNLSLFNVLLAVAIVVAKPSLFLFSCTVFCQ